MNVKTVPLWMRGFGVLVGFSTLLSSTILAGVIWIKPDDFTAVEKNSTAPSDIYPGALWSQRGNFYKVIPLPVGVRPVKLVAYIRGFTSSSALVELTRVKFGQDIETLAAIESAGLTDGIVALQTTTFTPNTLTTKNYRYCIMVNLMYDYCHGVKVFYE